MVVKASSRRSGRLRLPRLTAQLFRDLAIWMAALGLVVGLVFPLAIIPLGISRSQALRLPFFCATVSAGLLLARFNYLLARTVIGDRLRLVAGRMRHVGDVIGDAAYTGDYSTCSPEACALVVDSDDELGDVARAFNTLIEALAGSHQLSSATGTFTAALATHLDLDQLARKTLHDVLRLTGADAGALLVARDAELVVEASHRVTTEGLGASTAVRAGLESGEIALISVPETVVVDGALVTFRPAAVAVVPLHFQSVLVGGIVLAFARDPEPNVLRLVDGLRGSTSVALNNALIHERFQRLAAVDPLTGAYNRRFGLGRLAEEFARALRTTTPMSVLAFDLDHFKAINDTYGHLVGDRVLRDVVAAARLVLRQGDVLIRTGGEEFLALLPGAGIDDLRNLGERIRRAVGALTVTTAAGDVRVTVSLGGVTFPGSQADSVEGLLEAADQAMYASKNSGRDRLTIGGHRPLAVASPPADRTP